MGGMARGSYRVEYIQTHPVRKFEMINALNLYGENGWRYCEILKASKPGCVRILMYRVRPRYTSLT